MSVRHYELTCTTEREKMPNFILYYQQTCTDKSEYINLCLFNLNMHSHADISVKTALSDLLLPLYVYGLQYASSLEKVILVLSVHWLILGTPTYILRSRLHVCPGGFKSAVQITEINTNNQVNNISAVFWQQLVFILTF